MLRQLRMRLNAEHGVNLSDVKIVDSTHREEMLPNLTTVLEAWKVSDCKSRWPNLTDLRMRALFLAPRKLTQEAQRHGNENRL